MNKYHVRVEFSHPEDFHPEANQGFRISRYALSQLTKNHLGHEVLEIESFNHLKNNPETLVSLSHTKDAAAAIIANHSDYQGIGIDIEWRTRKYRPGIEKYFLLESDDKELPLLDLWCAKEAAYKAYFPHYRGEKVLVIKDLIIKNSKFYIEGNVDALGDILFENTEDYILAIALLEKKK
ncbi:4'-phosphopantetheinyl transferase superfamily protein [Bacteriovorax sp. Seq25_V]|uniref:4'-phosphopantetheinyl transferase superfamily protein n=1 Tax=Bacteriovorax sp. Seq25_V TaxID=1201288 RepID=UPI00038A0448|nr:4'-phosphopantetheinyl transferase superfamily protein [Bacteriovorax sp. Seq25_V]EQC43805.1 4'-phosphopantetheinyl transferase domain protein [Bacteriovorax sp. Seq25_V]